MNHHLIIEKLQQNHDVFAQLLRDKTAEEFLWKNKPEEWCLLEVVCHLYDEEREDFRARVKHTLETPDKPLPMFDQLAWVTSRAYIQQNYEDKVAAFLSEREQSISWLQSLTAPAWDNAYHHPKFGPMSASYFLTNWLAHDYLHIRQISKISFRYLHVASGHSLDYAGEL